MKAWQQRIAAIVDKHAASQTEFAREVGLPTNTINTWMKGKRCPSPGTVKEIARRFGYDSTGLFRFIRDGGEMPISSAIGQNSEISLKSAHTSPSANASSNGHDASATTAEKVGKMEQKLLNLTMALGEQTALAREYRTQLEEKRMEIAELYSENERLKKRAGRMPEKEKP